MAQTRNRGKIQSLALGAHVHMRADVGPSVIILLGLSFSELSASHSRVLTRHFTRSSSVEGGLVELWSLKGLDGEAASAQELWDKLDLDLREKEGDGGEVGGGCQLTKLTKV